MRGARTTRLSPRSPLRTGLWPGTRAAEGGAGGVGGGTRCCGSQPADTSVPPLRAVPVGGAALQPTPRLPPVHVYHTVNTNAVRAGKSPEHLRIRPRPAESTTSCIFNKPRCPFQRVNFRRYSYFYISPVNSPQWKNSRSSLIFKNVSTGYSQQNVRHKDKLISGAPVELCWVTPKMPFSRPFC